MILSRGRWRMTGRGYTIFDTGIGRCGIAWGPSALLACSFPRSARSIRGGGCFSSIRMRANFVLPRMSRSRSRASQPCCAAAACDFSEVTLDMTGIPAFNQRVYAYRPRDPARRDPHLCAKSPRPCALPARSIRWRRRSRRNPFMIIVPCHRVLEAGNYADKISPNGGAISKRRLLSIEGAQPDRQQDAVRRAAAGCAAAGRITKSAG